MAKLETLKRNIVRFKAERNKANSIKREYHPPRYEDILGPPNDLVNYYLDNIQVWASEHLLNNSTYTRVQQVHILDDFLMDLYRTTQVKDALLISNRSTYWKPKIKLINGECISVYLGDRQICNFS